MMCIQYCNKGTKEIRRHALLHVFLYQYAWFKHLNLPVEGQSCLAHNVLMTKHLFKASQKNTTLTSEIAKKRRSKWIILNVKHNNRFTNKSLHILQNQIKLTIAHRFVFSVNNVIVSHNINALMCVQTHYIL